MSRRHLAFVAALAVLLALPASAPAWQINSTKRVGRFLNITTAKLCTTSRYGDWAWTLRTTVYGKPVYIHWIEPLTHPDGKARHLRFVAMKGSGYDAMSVTKRKSLVAMFKANINGTTAAVSPGGKTVRRKPPGQRYLITAFAPKPGC